MNYTYPRQMKINKYEVLQLKIITQRNTLTGYNQTWIIIKIENIIKNMCTLEMSYLNTLNYNDSNYT